MSGGVVRGFMGMAVEEIKSGEVRGNYFRAVGGGSKA